MRGKARAIGGSQSLMGEEDAPLTEADLPEPVLIGVICPASMQEERSRVNPNTRGGRRSSADPAGGLTPPT